MVVPRAQDVQVALVGVAAVAPGDAVIDLAVSGGAIAVREPAALVPGDDVLGEVRRWPVGAAAVVDQPADRVGDQAVPGAGLVRGDPAGQGGGDRAVPVQLAGLLVQLEEGGQGDGDLHRRGGSAAGSPAPG